MIERFHIYTEEEMLDRHIGRSGTEERAEFENDFNNFLIGEAIREARLESNLTQQQLGDIAGVNRSQVSMAERGMNITVKTLSKLHRAMGLQARLTIPTVGEYAI